MSDESRDLREIHRELAQVVGDAVEDMIPEDTAYILVLFKFPGPECALHDEDLGGAVASNSAVMVPYALADAMKTVCDPRALIALVDAVTEAEDTKAGTC